MDNWLHCCQGSGFHWTGSAPALALSLVAPHQTQSFKLTLLFFVATSAAVLLAVGLNRRGAPTSVQATALAAPAKLPVLKDTTASSAAGLQTKNALAVSHAMPVEAYAVMKALPVVVPVTKPTSTTVINLPVSTASRPAEKGFQPFSDSMSDALRENLPKALPIPLVYQAVLMNDNQWLRDLLKAGMAVNDPTPGGDTALCAAIKARNTEAVELLVLHGADVSAPGRDGQAPLALACLLRTERAIPALLKAGADANATYQSPVPDSLLGLVSNPELKDGLRNDRGVTVLMAAAARGDAEAVIDLLQNGAKADRPTRRYYRYPINFAAEQSYLYVMRILLGRPADAEPDLVITVDLSKQKAYLRRFGEEIDRTTVSTGREGFDTPEGRYVVTDKHESWTSTVYHVEMPYFMRLNCSAIGLHAGYVTGEPASHGCIRLPHDKVRKWFALVKVGDEVEVVRGR